MAKRFVIGWIFLLFWSAGYCYAATSGSFVDPMRPVHYPTKVVKKSVEKEDRVDTQHWKLLAVLISAERSVAVINGRSLQVGDQLEGYELVKIAADRAVLKNKQSILVLRRAGTGLKKVSADKDIRKGSKP